MLTEEGTKNAKINITLRVKEHRNDTGIAFIYDDQLL